MKVFARALLINFLLFLCCCSFAINSSDISEKINILMQIGNKTVNVNGVKKTLDDSLFLKEQMMEFLNLINLFLRNILEK